MAQAHEHHRGIVLAAQRSSTISELVAALDRLVSEADAEEIVGRIGWLNQWRTG